MTNNISAFLRPGRRPTTLEALIPQEINLKFQKGLLLPKSARILYCHGICALSRSSFLCPSLPPVPLELALSPPGTVSAPVPEYY